MIRLNRAFLLSILLIFSFSTFFTPLNSKADTIKVSSEVKIDQEDLTKFVDEFFSNEQVQKIAPGAVVTVVQGDQILLNKGYGYADVEKKTAVNPEETLFRVGSVTKSFTAIGRPRESGSRGRYPNVLSGHKI